MRPTIDDQLRGAQRLLDGVGRDTGLSPASRELLRNAGRLLHRVSTSWASALPFLVTDNAEMSDLLRRVAPTVPALSGDIDGAVGTAGADTNAPEVDLSTVSARNTALRAVLARAIRELPRTDAGDGARSEIGDYLRRRVEADPT